MTKRGCGVTGLLLAGGGIVRAQARFSWLRRLSAAGLPSRVAG
ncbi:hypothetical protein [Nitrolancea hollandica]|nr:hypothetical protein [Nitrolancea hollandica]